MLNQEYVFQLLHDKGIHTVAELSRVLGVNYHTLRYELNRGSLRFELTVRLADFLGVPVSSLLRYPKRYFIRCAQLGRKDIEYEMDSFQNISHVMFVILSSEVL